MKTHFLGLAVVALAGALLIGCSDGPERDDSGQIVGEGNLGVFDFNVGDCFQYPQVQTAGGATGIADVQAVPCYTPHDNEVFYLHDLSGQFADFPGEAQVDDASSAACQAQFQAYVGQASESSRLNYTWLSPTSETWDDNDDREVVCALYDNDRLKLTASMRNSGE
jgi:hypothetical protein